MKIATRTVAVADGWDVWVDYVDFPEGFPVLVHAGSPGTRRLFGPAAEHAASGHGLRLIGYDRPGFGDSPPRPGRRVADAADETRAIAEALGISKLATWSFSGGGPFALASAALLPELVTACCVIASLAPYGVPRLDFAAGWSEEHRKEVELFFTDRELAREHFRAEAAELFEVLSTAEGWLARWGDAAGTDEAHGREIAEYLALITRDASRQSDQGWWDDWVAYLTPWGFDLGTITVPVQLWHGELDAAAPAAHGHWLAERIPGVEAHFLATEDHATIEPNHRSETYAWLKRHG